jgi:hypothetical protein
MKAVRVARWIGARETLCGLEARAYWSAVMTQFLPADLAR